MVSAWDAAGIEDGTEASPSEPRATRSCRRLAKSRTRPAGHLQRSGELDGKAIANDVHRRVRPVLSGNRADRLLFRPSLR